MQFIGFGEIYVIDGYIVGNLLLVFGGGGIWGSGGSGHDGVMRGDLDLEFDG